MIDAQVCLSHLSVFRAAEYVSHGFGERSQHQRSPAEKCVGTLLHISRELVAHDGPLTSTLMRLTRAVWHLSTRVHAPLRSGNTS